MAKRRSDPALDAGERLLADWGVDAAASAAALGELIGRAAAADSAIAARLGEIASAESAALLQRLERDSADRAARKEAKRALYRLEQRGVTVEHGAVAAAAKPILGPELEGYVSAVDGRGDQLLWILRTRADGLLHFFAVLNDPEGLREVSLSAITRKSLREIRAELEQRHDLRLVETDWRYADFLVHRAHGWARERGARIEGDYLGLRAQITHAPHVEMENPLWQRVGRDEVAADSWLQSSAEVLGEPELRTWFPDPAQLGPSLEELENIRNSPLVLNRAQQEERFEAVVGAAIEQIFGAAGSDSWQRRLEQMAYFFSASKRPERARQCAAAAEGLRRGLPFAEIPLLAMLLRGGLGAFFRRAVEADAERQESSLIVTPQQLREQHKRR